MGICLVTSTCMTMICKIKFETFAIGYIDLNECCTILSTDNTSSKRYLNCNKGENCITHNLWNEFSEQLSAYLGSISLADIIKDQIVIKTQYQLDETTRRISTMFPVSAKLMVA